MVGIRKILEEGISKTGVIKLCWGIKKTSPVNLQRSGDAR